MKVLITHELFAPDFAGGGEYVALETARGLQQRGVDVRVLTTGDPAMTDYEGIPTTRLPIHRYRLNFAARTIAAHARDVDLVHTFNYHACWPSLRAARSLNKPVVCQILGLFGEAWKRMRPPGIARVWMAWERFLARRPFDRVICPSDTSRDLAVSMGADSRRAVVNNPGIDVDAYRPTRPKEDVVLFVGKRERRKGIGEVFEVARRLPHVRFELFGWDGDHLRATAPPNVDFVAFERGPPLRRAFARARIFLFPSHAETFGIAVAEAMAAGCAIVSTVPLPFEGARVAVGDVEAMTAAVDRLWGDRACCTRMGQVNQDWAGYYTWSRYTDTLLEVYRGVLGS